MRKRRITLVSIFACFILFLGILFYNFNTKLSMELTGEEQITIECGSEFEDPGANASSKFLFFSNKDRKVKQSGKVDTSKLGDYTVTYKTSTLFKSITKTRIVSVVDTTPPTITLTPQGDHYTMPGERYEEDGYTITDNYDEGLASMVTRVEENGIVTYTVKDSSGNEATVTREIQYADITAPVITLNGGGTISITVGDSYSDAGYSAIDDRDGDVTANVSVEGSVDSNTEGTYTITYRVTDSFGNVGTATRTITVNKKVVQQPSNPTNDGNKIVYLTFDDGPGPYTQQLLDILAKYNVKVTFFVTAQYPAYLNLIGSEVAAGHAVGIHTTTHNYSQIYASTDAFYADLNQMSGIIKQYGGITTHITRFPGGSSNMVSANYCKGIMSSLTQSIVANGYQYFDWNVTSGDAGGTTDANVVASNVINGISTHNVSVVLQHDIKQFSVVATEQIIQWGLANGYTFLPLNTSSFAAHHGVNN